MTLRDELSLLIDPSKSRLAGVLGLTPQQVKVPNRKGYVWVRLLDNPSEAVQAYNRKTSNKYDLPVWISFDGKKYVVDGVDGNRYVWESDAAFLPEHAQQHSSMRAGGDGSDVLWVDQTQFLPLLALPVGYTGSNSVNVSPYVFQNAKGEWTYPGNTGVFVPIPTTGSIVSLIMLRDEDSKFYTIPGTEFVPDTVSGTLSMLARIPLGREETKNDIPIAAVRVRCGQPILWDDILDIRQFYKGHVVAPSGTSFMEAINIFYSGTFVGTATDLNFLGDFSIGVEGTRADITPVIPRKILFTTEDLTFQITGTNQHFGLTGTSTTPVNVYCNTRQPPSEVVMDADMRGFTLSYIPTDRDMLVVDYMMQEILAYPMEWIIVGGGGGGGFPGTGTNALRMYYASPAGGGGGGEVIQSSGTLMVTEGQTFSFVVGSGGASGVSGSHSQLKLYDSPGTYTPPYLAEGGFAPVDDSVNTSTTGFVPRKGGRSGGVLAGNGYNGSSGGIRTYYNSVLNQTGTVPVGGGGGSSFSSGTVQTGLGYVAYGDDGGAGVLWPPVMYYNSSGYVGDGGGGGVPYGTDYVKAGRGGGHNGYYGQGYNGQSTSPPFLGTAAPGANGSGGGGGGGGVWGYTQPSIGREGGHGLVSFRVSATVPLLPTNGHTFVMGAYRYYNFLTPGSGTITF